MMGFGVNRILVIRIGMLCVVCLTMAIRVIDILDRVLFSIYVVSIGLRTGRFFVNSKYSQ